MKSESKNGEALQESLRTHGTPIAIKMDFVQSEPGKLRQPPAETIKLSKIRLNHTISIKI